MTAAAREGLARCWSATYLPHRAYRVLDTSGTHSAARQGHCPCLSLGGAAAWGQVPPLKALGTSCGWAGSLVLLPPRAPIPPEHSPRSSRWGRAACAHRPGRWGGSRERARLCGVCTHVPTRCTRGHATKQDSGHGWQTWEEVLSVAACAMLVLGEAPCLQRAHVYSAGAPCAARGPLHPSARTLQGQSAQGGESGPRHFGGRKGLQAARGCTGTARGPEPAQLTGRRGFAEKPV